MLWRGSARVTFKRVRLLKEIDIVANGVPFLPHAPRYNTIDAFKALQHFQVGVLDVVDVVVSKLKRFSANDIGDIQAMVDRGHVDHPLLVTRFRFAVDAFLGDARAQDLPR
jgi:hypothetical protein